MKKVLLFVFTFCLTQLFVSASYTDLFIADVEYDWINKSLVEKESIIQEIYDIIWKIIKEVNKTLTSYKAIKSLEIKTDDFEMTTTMKIKRYKEIQKDV